MKICSKCKEEKDLSLFHRRSRSKDGLCSRCVICRSEDKKQDPNEKKRQSEWNLKNNLYNRERAREYYSKNKEIISVKNKSLDRRKKAALRSRTRYYKNRDSILQRKKEKRATDPREKEYNKKSRDKNKCRMRLLHSLRIKNDQLYKLTRNLRSRLNKYIGMKKSVSAVRDLGCTIEYFKYHLESKFLPGMTWDNYGYKGWHIDHIVPLSFAKTEEEIVKLCHYTNLQPLWAKDNLSKSNKYVKDLKNED